MTTVDLFAGGAAGWDVAANRLGLHTIGLEHDSTACASRALRQLPTVQCDLHTYTMRTAVLLGGLIASPPCQDFSTAGLGAGRTGDRGRLIDIVPQWVARHRPQWVACEQVPPCEAIWAEHAMYYQTLGYRTWVGVLNAVNYGVPQHRKRAILMAHQHRQPRCPAPTHAEHGGGGLFPLETWVSMAQALQWDGNVHVGFPRADDTGTSPDGYRLRDWRHIDEPAFTVTEKARSWQIDTRRGAEPDGTTQLVDAAAPAPAPAVTGGSGSQWVHADTRAPALTVADALVLQSFAPDLPLAGGKTAQFLQVGNAIPPLLAHAILSQLVGATT